MLKRLWCWLWGHERLGWFDYYDKDGRLMTSLKPIKWCKRCGAKL